MMPDKVFIDIATCDYTKDEMMAAINQLIADHPEYEIYMDGDEYAIVGRLRNLGYTDSPAPKIIAEPKFVSDEDLSNLIDCNHKLATVARENRRS